ncbi:MAG: energy-coupling factor ABC transporter permease [Muribaculaceae bacterium]|nr:energy-coupling factor ABC transporter permease [Muribaculaceae bacterium]
MHMSDAMLSPVVAIAADVVAGALLVVAGSKLKNSTRENLVPLMGVTGAFIFAAQMVNFAIPGTGSSGHIVGGVLLAALLGPWAGFLTLASVLIIQCLIFADGGLMAIGCNVLNMGAMTALIAYPVIFKPLLKFDGVRRPSDLRIFVISIVACVVGLELGAVMVSLETLLSGVTAIPAGKFFVLMTSIHLAIGVVEGLATGAVIVFINRTRPALLSSGTHDEQHNSLKRPIIAFALAAVVVAGGLSFLASSDPDGLEWSIEKVTGSTDLPVNANALSEGSQAVQSATSIMPDYENSFSGIVGAVMVLILVWAVSSLLIKKRRT